MNTTSVAQDPTMTIAPRVPMRKQMLAVGGRVAWRPTPEQRLVQIRSALADLLGEAMALELGLTAVNLAALPPAMRHRLDDLAGRALQSLDPDYRLEAQRTALAETLGWAAGQPSGLTPHDLLAEGLARYEAILSRPTC
jgi:hypothetical protein